MAVTFVLPDVWKGSFKTGIAVINLGVYATGGVAVSPATLGITTVYMVKFGGNDSGFGYSWDYTTGKIKVWVQGITTGGTAAGALANGAFILADDGTETVIRASNTAISTTYEFQALKELSNGVDLSAVANNIRIEMVGL